MTTNEEFGDYCEVPTCPACGWGDWMEKGIGMLRPHSICPKCGHKPLELTIGRYRFVVTRGWFGFVHRCDCVGFAPKLEM
jgi:hypothetical protein